MPRLFRLLSIAVLAGGLVSGCGFGEPADAVRAPPPAFFLGGIQVDEPDNRRWLDALESAGMNTVSVTEYARHGDWDTADLSWDEEDEDLLAEIRAAKRRGFAAVLILRVELDDDSERNNFLWHGMIMPRSDELLASWFDEYTRFALAWAWIAERQGVDALMIGSEMNALASTVALIEVPVLEEYFLNEEKQEERRSELLRHAGAVRPALRGGAVRPALRGGSGEAEPLAATVDARIAVERSWAEQVAFAGDPEALDKQNARRRLLQSHWIGVIESVREVYGGRVGYAANFDQYQMVGFWPHLDVMGINAYFKLRDRPLSADRAGSPPRWKREHGSESAGEIADRLEHGWRRALGDIREFRAAQGLGGRPVIFTEMGYTYRLNSTLEPWADEGFSLIRFDEREELVVWRDQPDALWERAAAVRALYRVHSELEATFLEGILYWKLSTVPSHRDIESFVVILGGSEEDPVLPELRRFVAP